MIDTRLYSIRWFDTTKAGNLIVRKYEGKIQQTDDCYIVLYRKKIKFIRKADCFVYVWENNQWQSA